MAGRTDQAWGLGRGLRGGWFRLFGKIAFVEGWEGPGSDPPRIGQNRLCGRAGRGQVSYPPRIGQNRLCGREGPGYPPRIGQNRFCGTYPPRIGQNRLCGRAGRGQVSYPPRIGQNRLWGRSLSAADRATSPLWGWEGPGFLSAADRAKSPLWEGWEGQVSYPSADSYPPRIGQNCGRAGRGQVSYSSRIGQNRLCGRVGRGQVSYPWRIGQTRLYGRAEGPGFLSAAHRAKWFSPLWEGWEKFPIRPMWEGWEGPGFPCAQIGQNRLCGRAGRGQVSYPPRIAKSPARAGRGHFLSAADRAKLPL